MNALLGLSLDAPYCINNYISQISKFDQRSIYSNYLDSHLSRLDLLSNLANSDRLNLKMIGNFEDYSASTRLIVEYVVNTLDLELQQYQKDSIRLCFGDSISKQKKGEATDLTITIDDCFGGFIDPSNQSKKAKFYFFIIQKIHQGKISRLGRKTEIISEYLKVARNLN